MSNQFSYSFKKSDLLVTALTHKSFAHENQLGENNEKLEFLGDAVLDLVLSEYLMERFPEDSEGSLSKKRASLVNEATLSQIAVKLGLPEHLRLGKGELGSGGSQKPRLLAGVYEALIGAVFVDGGFSEAKQLARQHFEQILIEMDPADDFNQDYKTRFQELVQSLKMPSPVYKVTGETGPSHSPSFEVSVLVQAEVIAAGSGRSKKHAEQAAAKNAFETWGAKTQSSKGGKGSRTES